MYDGNTTHFIRISDTPTGWFHLTVIYHRAENDVDIYYNGERKSASLGAMISVPSGSGQMVIGRHYVDLDSGYATVEVDELTLWNN